MLALALSGTGVDALVADAKQTDSDGIAIALDGKLVRSESWSRAPTNVQSITKLFTGIAIELLVDDGKIPSFDAPLATWFPEWRGTPKAAITLREVMEHTSGLREPKYAELMAAHDAVAFVAALPLEAEPGTRRRYSNAAPALLARVIERVSGQHEDAFVAQRLGLASLTWARDGSGNPHAWEGLALTAEELARVGLWLAVHPPRGPDFLERPRDGLLMIAGARGNLLLVDVAHRAVLARVRHASSRDRFDPDAFLELLR